MASPVPLSRAGTRIVLHTPEPSSGAAHYVSSLAKALLHADQPVVLFCPRNFAYAADLRRIGGEIICVGGRSTAVAGPMTRLTRNLRFFGISCLGQVRSIEPGDIVHFQFPLYFPAGLVFFLLAKLQARGIVYTAHDPVPHKWLLPTWLRFLERGCLHWAYTLSDRIIVHNDSARDLIVRVFGQAPEKVAVIPHGSAALEISEVTFRVSDALELLMFGSIREDKGVDLAIEAVQRVNARGLKVRLLIAGAVANAREQAYWAGCEDRIQRCSTGITVVERFIPDEEVSRLLLGCHAVLLPYKNVDSESGVAAVALGSGRALIATNTGSFAPLLKAADLGVAIESPCVDSVEAAIRAALSLGPQALRNKGLRGLDFVRSTRSWEFIGKQTASLYAELPIRR